MGSRIITYKTKNARKVFHDMIWKDHKHIKFNPQAHLALSGHNFKVKLWYGRSLYIIPLDVEGHMGWVWNNHRFGGWKGEGGHHGHYYDETMLSGETIYVK